VISLSLRLLGRIAAIRGSLQRLGVIAAIRVMRASWVSKVVRVISV
jgi:hypothetical protein